MIKGKSDKGKALQSILRNIIPKKDEFYTLSSHDAFSSSYHTHVPYKLTNSYYSSVVGTAFDYMARLMIAKRISTSSEKVWIDLASEKGLESLLRGSSKNLRRNLTKKYNNGQMIAKKFVESQRNLSDELLAYSTYLARLEHVYRSGMPPQDIEKSLLSDEVDEIINELKVMCEVFKSKFITSDIITSESDVAFNPHFGTVSRACNGADADIFIDGILYDFKTTKTIGYKWQDIAQIFGYYFLNEIAKKINDINAPLYNKEIKSLAFYKARYGEFEIVDLKTLNQNELKQTRDEIATVLNIDSTVKYSTRKSNKFSTAKMKIKNKKDILRLEDDIKHIKTNANQFNEDYFNQRTIDNWGILKENQAIEDLKTMPIDTISTLEKRMPINALMSQGLQTIYDIRNKDAYDLMELDGEGSVSAEAIVEAVGKIKTSVYEQARPRVNPDDLSDGDFELLESIYTKRELLKLVESLRADIEAFHEEIRNDMETAKEHKKFPLSLFQPKAKKEKITSAFNELNKEKHRDSLNNMNERITEILEFTVDRNDLKEHFIKENASYYTEIEKVTGFTQTDMTKDLPSEIVDEVNRYTLNTTDLKVNLRMYQEFGAKYGLHFKRTLLGDEMGLGKTIQALAMINHLYQNDQKYSIVVCPLSILANWKREVELHSALKTFVFHGNNRETEFAKWQEEKGILLTTYEHTLRMDVEELQKLDILIVDEAHYVKNAEAKRSQSVYTLASISEYVLFMSGTPLENRLEEMKQLISVLQEDIADKLSQELHLLQPTEFKKTVASVYLRRNRKDVLAELPELEIIPQWMD